MISSGGFLNGLLTFIGGLAAGWALHEVAGEARPRAKAAKRKGSSSSAAAPGVRKRGVAVAAPGRKPRAAVARPKEELKMVLCVNTGLGMGKGKIGAQCAHAAVGLVQRYLGKHEAAFRQWESCGQPKIALKIKDEAEMAQLAAKAQQAGLMTYIVHDAGRTQIAAGSQTVLAIGPGPKSHIDVVTGHLSLM